MSKQPVSNNATKSKFVRPMTTWVSILTLCLGLGAFLSNSTELAEAYERVTCGKACPSLTADELRLKVIKAYLHHMLDINIERLEFASREQLVLLPVHLTAASLAQGINDSTLLATLTTNALLIQTHAQIEALESSVLATHPSIAEYSLSYRYATVIPIQSIQPIRLQDVDPSLEPHVAAARSIGRWERLRGYGEHFFQVTEYGGLSLACCDGKGDENETSTVWWLKRNSLTNIQSTHPWIFAVSDRGVILFWEIPGENHLFYRLLSTQPPTFKKHP